MKSETKAGDGDGDGPSSGMISEAEYRETASLKIIWSFISFLLSGTDMAVIIWLSHLHFSSNESIIAWLMLTPILLNFVGIFTYLSK